MIKLENKVTLLPCLSSITYTVKKKKKSIYCIINNKETKMSKECFSKKCSLCHMKLDITYNILRTYISREDGLGDHLCL